MDRKAHNATHFQGGCSKEVEQIICNLQGWWFNSCLLQFACQIYSGGEHWPQVSPQCIHWSVKLMKHWIKCSCKWGISYKAFWWLRKSRKVLYIKTSVYHLPFINHGFIWRRQLPKRTRAVLKKLGGHTKYWLSNLLELFKFCFSLI